MKRKRFIALALCLGLTLVLTASSVFLILEADHNCIGEGCDICARITATVQLLRGLSLLGVLLLTLMTALLAVRKNRGVIRRAGRLVLTPVSWQVRLNNSVHPPVKP